MAAAPRENPESDRLLVEACLRGESDPWEKLVRRYGGLVYTVIRRYGLDDDDTADVFQNTWSALWAQLAEVRRHDKLSAWLITVAARLSYQQLGRRQSQEAHQGSEAGLQDEVATAGQPEEIALLHDEAASVRDALSKLPARCRELLGYLFYDEEAPTYEEISRRLGLSPGSVGVIRKRCLEHLRLLLEDGRSRLGPGTKGRN